MTVSASAQLPVLVFGTTVTALGAVRMFARLGHPVWTHTEPGDVVTLSRYYRPMPLPAGFDPKAPMAARLEAILRALPMPRAFLLPCTDFWTEAATELPDDLKARFPACLSPREAIYTLTDKGRLAASMATLGLPHPRSFAVEREEDLAAIDDRVFESAFLKPKSSPLFLQVFKAKGIHVHSRAEALARFREVKAAGFEVILQEYVPGPPTEHFFIDGFMDQHHVVRARFARQRLRMYPPDFGNSTYMVSVPIATVQPAMDALETLLRHLRYRGIFSAEYKRDAARRQVSPDRSQRAAVVVRGICRALWRSGLRDGLCRCAGPAVADAASVPDRFQVRLSALRRAGVQLASSPGHATRIAVGLRGSVAHVVQAGVRLGRSASGDLRHPGFARPVAGQAAGLRQGLEPRVPGMESQGAVRVR